MVKNKNAGKPQYYALGRSSSIWPVKNVPLKAVYKFLKKNGQDFTIEGTITESRHEEYVEEY